MKPSAFDEVAFFRAVQQSGARALLIGRRALVLLGIPVLTADYDYWISIEDIAVFNGAAAPFNLAPTRTPDEARHKGRYVLENDEHIDVLVARSVPTVDGLVVKFNRVWANRASIDVQPGLRIDVPAVDDLILTKQFAPRPKDLESLVHEWSERLVSADEVHAALGRPIDPEEREELIALVRWFTRRYPTGADRLAYVRQAYERWTRLGNGKKVPSRRVDMP